MFNALMLTLVLARGADVATSLYGFAHGADEANPVFLSTKPVPFVAQQVTMTVAMLVLTRKVHHAGHPGFARVALLTGIAIGVGAATHNLVVIQGLP